MRALGKFINNSILVKSISCWCIWRIVIQVAATVASFFFEYKPSFPYSRELLLNNKLPPSISLMGSFDGVHYIGIADQGYKSADLIQAFFPTYPLLMRAFSLITNNSIISGLIISNLATIGCIYFGCKIAEKWFNSKTATYFIAVLLTFPTSFYLGAVYNESLFLLLLLAGVWYGEQNKKLISGVLVGLLSGVRLVGLMLPVSFLLKWMVDAGKKSKLSFKKIFLTNRRFICGMIIGSIIFGVYIYYLYINHNDPFYFYTVQSSFGAGRETRLILLPQTIYRSVKILLTARPIDFKYYSYFQDLLLSSGFLLGIILSWKKLKLEYAFFCLLAYLLPTFTGNLSSMPRYLLVLFPIMIWWANHIANKPKLKLLYFTVSIIMLVINIMLFSQGYWVA